jgi:hypothetical protein
LYDIISDLNTLSLAKTSELLWHTRDDGTNLTKMKQQAIEQNASALGY